MELYSVTLAAGPVVALKESDQYGLSLPFSLPVPLSASPCLSLFQPVFYQSLRRSFFISAFLALWRNYVNLRESNVNLRCCCFVRGIESSQCR